MTVLRDRLLDHVVAGPGGCWIWDEPGSVNAAGYVYIRLDGRSTRVHRAAYEEFVGPIPAGLVIDHVCHNRDASCPGGPACLHRRCFRPDHLESTTDRVNVRRGKTIAARYAAATHCVHGHEWTPENTRIRRNGTRECRICRRDWKRADRQRRAAQ